MLLRSRAFQKMKLIAARPPSTQPAHAYFGTIELDRTVLLCLHRWGDHAHPTLASPGRAEPGNGLLLFFRVEDFDGALSRARALVTVLEDEPHVNSNTGTRELHCAIPMATTS